MTVIERDQATVEIGIRMRQRDDTIGRGQYRGAGRSGDIDTVMRSSGLAIQDTLAAVDAGYSSNRRPDEAGFVIRALIIELACLLDQPGFGVNALQIFFVRCDLARGQTIDALNVVLPRLDVQIPGFDGTVRVGHFQVQPGRLIAMKTNQKIALLGYSNCLVCKHHFAARRHIPLHQSALHQRTVQHERFGRNGERKGGHNGEKQVTNQGTDPRHFRGARHRSSLVC